MNSNRPNFKRQKSSHQITYNSIYLSKSKAISTILSVSFSTNLSVSFSLNFFQKPLVLVAYLLGNFCRLFILNVFVPQRYNRFSYDTSLLIKT